MFYCDKCREKNKWPFGFMRSFGPCEVCGETAHCYDVPSKCIPLRISQKELDEVNATLKKHGHPPLEGDDIIVEG